MYNDLNNYHNKLLSNVNKIDAFDTKQCIKKNKIDSNIYVNLETCNFNKFNDDSKIKCNNYDKISLKKNSNTNNIINTNTNTNSNFFRNIFNNALLLIISILFVIGTLKKNSMYIIIVLLILILYVFIKITNII
tara:strand:+ start:1261 stop:1662 length:402 start_codon:yes stop_codon:yes gene_type:complete